MDKHWAMKETAKRYVWTLINSVLKTDCAKIMGDCGASDTDIFTFCDDDEFSNFDKFGVWIEVVFGNTASQEAFLLETTLSDYARIHLFEDFTFEKGLAGMVNKKLMDISKEFGCTTQKNVITGSAACSDFEMFYQQWAKRSLTQNIVGGNLYKQSKELPVAPSMVGWGLAIPKALEYNLY